MAVAVVMGAILCLLGMRWFRVAMGAYLAASPAPQELPSGLQRILLAHVAAQVEWQEQEELAKQDCRQQWVAVQVGPLAQLVEMAVLGPLA